MAKPCRGLLYLAFTLPFVYLRYNIQIDTFWFESFCKLKTRNEITIEKSKFHVIEYMFS